MLGAAADCSHWAVAKEWLLLNHAGVSPHDLASLKALIEWQTARSQGLLARDGDPAEQPAVQVAGEGVQPHVALPNPQPNRPAAARAVIGENLPSFCPVCDMNQAWAG